MNIKIMVVTHKDYEMPDEDIYFPICVGTNIEKLHTKYQPDNVGINISNKNSMYSELTALYWAWKNMEFDVLGLVHYRRHLSAQKGARDLSKVINRGQLIELFENHDVIVAKPRIYIETVKNHYINCQHGQKKKAAKRLAILEQVISDKCPQYMPQFRDLMNGHKAHMFNIFIMNKHDLNQYCTWLFDILFEAEERINSEKVEYSRGMGELSEFLLDTWLRYHKKTIYEAYVIQYGYNFWQKAKFVINRRLFGGNVK